MANFKTALKVLARGDLEFDAVSKNISKLLDNRPQMADTIMEELRSAYGEDLIDATIYARLKNIVSGYIAADDPNDDATSFDDATQMDSGADATAFTGLTNSSTIAQQARDAINAASNSDNTVDFYLTGDSMPSSGSWPPDDAKPSTDGEGTSGNDVEAKIEPGSVLKDRFKLDDVLGVGGMSTVYRGRDLIKVEARDKNPYVALKVLNEDFK